MDKAATGQSLRNKTAPAAAQSDDSHSFVPHTLFQEDRFAAPFDESSFIDSLTYRLLNVAKKDEFDLHASEFDALFRDARKLLVKLSSDVDRDIDAAEHQVDEAEGAYNEEIEVLREEMGEIFKNLKNLDDTIANIGGSALQIGERLENLDLQKVRALEARDLLDYFEHFMTSDTIEGLHHDEMATILKELMACSSNLSHTTPGYETAVRNIDACCERVEKELLAEFDSGVRLLGSNMQEGLAIMRDCATILYDLNRADQCMRRYVAMNDFFLRDASLYLAQESPVPQRESPNVVREPTGRGSLSIAANASQNSNNNTGSNGNNNDLPTLVKLFRNVEETIDREYRIMKYVFIDFERGVQLLVERVFEQTINARLSTILRHDPGEDLMVHLQTLSKVQEMMDDLVTRISKYELADFHPRALAEAILAPYKKNYMEEEIAALTLYYDQLFNDFIESENPQAAAANAAAAEKERQQSQQSRMRIVAAAAMLAEKLQLAQVKLQEKLKKLASIFVRRDSTHLSTVVNPMALETVTQFIYYNAESLGRCRRLAPATKVAESCIRIFNVLLDRLGQFLQNILDAGLADFSRTDGHREDVGVSFLFMISVTNHIVQKLERHFENEMVRELESSLTLRMEVVGRKTEMLQSLENKIVAGLEKTLALIVNLIEEKLRVEQKRSDFRPREDANESLSIGATHACKEAIAFLNKYFSTIAVSLDGRNRDIFSHELGRELYRLLIRHLKTFTINSVGALQWMRDASEYQRCLAQLNNAPIDELFDRLRDLSNVFLVEPESLRDSVMSSSLADMPRDELVEVIRLREDMRNKRTVEIMHLL